MKFLIMFRFGAAVSPIIQSAELSETIKKRQERFGVVTKDEPKVGKPVDLLEEMGVDFHFDLGWTQEYRDIFLNGSRSKVLKTSVEHLSRHYQYRCIA